MGCGRIVDHLREGIETPENEIFFVGYQVERTLGRQIIRYHKKPGPPCFGGDFGEFRFQVKSRAGAELEI